MKAQQEAERVFGNDGIYIEKFIVQPRHIEIQIGWRPKRECLSSLRKRLFCAATTPKLIEECPSPFVDEKLRKKMGDVAIKAAKYINFEGMVP